jgi:glyoxylase-like metal-dependent hydrolase (beta-lactamase superfamily II)
VTAGRTDWGGSGPEIVAEGIHRIPFPLTSDSLNAVNVCAMATGQGLTMIDGGWALAESEERLRDGLVQIGLGFEDIRQLLVTHCHGDHCTQAIAVRRKLLSEVAIRENPTSPS